jgi:hypothetical protein
MQDKYLKYQGTSRMMSCAVPEMERDVTGLPMIEKMDQAMFGPNA